MNVKPLSRDYVTIVSGLPRSGTSMMMSAIEAGGIASIVDNIRQADEDNPKGYFEFEAVKKTKEDASWLNEAVGKVVKMVYRLLYDLPKTQWYKVVFMRRDLKEVLASQNIMLERAGKAAAGGSDDRMEELFAAELQRCEKWLSEQPNFKILYVDHRDMINAGRETTQKIAAFLDNGLDEEAMAAVVDPGLYRNRS